MNFQEYLKSIHACEEASLWAKDKTATEVWETCERPDWLMWWATRRGHINELNKLMGVAKQLADFVQKYNSTYAAAAAAYAYANADAADATGYAASAAVYAASYAADAAYAAAANKEDIQQLLKIIRDNLVQPWIEPTSINLKLQDDLGSFDDSL